MKKTIGIIIGVLLSIVAAQAQDYVALDCFMKKYCQNWKVGCEQQIAGTERWELVEQLGQPMPEFYFTKQLNSKKLRGKFVVLNFWATWCGGCRILSCDIDTVMRRDPGVYEGVQVIGVDANETLADKGYKAEAWWKEKGIGYPTVGGKNADACCASVNGGHPTAMLVDDKGIIRGRWDAWSPSVAEAIHVAVWALKDKPRADAGTVDALMANREYMKALYLMELLPEDAVNPLFRYVCLVECGKAHLANEYVQQMKEKHEAGRTEMGRNWKPNVHYAAFLAGVADYVYRLRTDDIYILWDGMNAATTVMNTGINSNMDFQMKTAVLRIRYGEANKQRGKGMLKHILDEAKKAQRPTEEIEYMEKMLKE